MTENNNENVTRKRRRMYDPIVEDDNNNTNEKTEKEPDQYVEEVRMQRETNSDKIIDDFTHRSMGLRFAPIKILNNYGVVNLQLKMLSKIAEVYGVKYSEFSGKALLISYIGILRSKTSEGFISNLSKKISGLGMIAGTLNMPKYVGASTYAIGKVIRKHFSNGGSLIDFDSNEMKDYYIEQFYIGQKLIKKY